MTIPVSANKISEWMIRQLPRGNKVYFLGAGASKSIRPFLPVASELTLSRIIDPESYCNDIPPIHECQALGALLKTVPEGPSLLDSPLEEALGRLKLAGAECYEGILYCLAMRLSIWGYNPDGDPGFKGWLKSVRRERNTIITTNYDTLPEEALALMGTDEYLPNDRISRDSLHWLDFGVSREKMHAFLGGGGWKTVPERSILFLKLHGSISWLFCEECETYCLDPIWQNAADAIVNPGAYAACPECSHKHPVRRRVIVPPLPVKEYTDAAIREIWEQAERALSRAEEIVFVGFSMSPTDTGVHELLAKAHRSSNTRRVTVIDRDPSTVAESYKRIYGDDVEFPAEKDWKTYLERRFAPRAATAGRTHQC